MRASRSAIRALTVAAVIAGGIVASAGRASAIIASAAPDVRAAADPVESATSWLAVVDSGKFAESWDESGAFFRKSLTKRQWVQALTAARAPLGDLQTRVLKSKTAMSTLPGAPDGQYVVMQFQTSFANRASAVETLTVMREPDHSWRVVGYYIK